jgi:non-ribosomal peptide synthetase-like protein
MITSPWDLTVELQAAPISDWSVRRYDGEAVVLQGSTSGGETRLNQLFEARCDQLARARQGGRLAVQTESESLTFRQLDELANKTARHLARRGIKAGDRVGLLFDRSVWAYTSMLAVMKLGAVYVPMDRLFPADRIQFIADDSGIRTILSVSAYADLVEAAGTDVVLLDELRDLIERESGRHFPARRNLSGQDLCYIIYTSGSTGKPKGVPITHANICNFVQAACDIYGLTTHDRVYQGLTLAFDFAVEEIWVPLVSGATLVPAPSGITLIGPDLSDFLRTQRITALCCVPTLLATVDPDLPELTFLLVSGEACPDELANRWQTEGRRFLNVYGPTEATVSATWIELRPEGKVTIGGPLPSYSIVVLHPDEPRCMARGEIGEICIAGPGLAPGYLNREDKTKAAFIDDFIGIENNPSGKIYRTGDLGRINADNEIEYLGRIDTQVKIRGYRIELDEISSTLMEAPGIAQAVVIDHTNAAGVTDLAAYFTVQPGETPAAPGQLQQMLKDRLPPYMVPSSFTELDELPMLPSHKVDRRRLPDPAAARVAAATAADHVAPVDEVETHIASAFAKVLGLPHVSTSGNFFDDLGASSLLLVQVCNELRTDPRFAEVSVKDLYLHPTITELARHLDIAPAGTVPTSRAADRDAPYRASRAQHVFCGTLQILTILSSLVLGAIAISYGATWLLDAPTAASALGRSLALGPGLFVAATAVSVALKWIVIGRWRIEQFPVWSFRYYRYWLAKGVIRANPMRAFAGSPLYNVYLRLLGAKIGRNVSIFTTNVPVCTDLITIENDVVIRPATTFNGAKVEDGYVKTGQVSIRAHGYIGESCVLDINSRVGTFSTVGHKSCLHEGQRVPMLRTVHGSPAEPTETDYRFVTSAGSGVRDRRIAYSLWRVTTVLVALTLAGLAAWFITRVVADLMTSAFAPLPGSGLTEDVIGLALVGTALYLAVLVLGLVPMAVVPWVGSRLLEPDRTYPLYGIHYMVALTVSRFGNSVFYNSLFGDSSLIVHFLRWIGYDLSHVVQSGVNFGLAQRQGNPRLCRVGSGTMVSDGLTMMNFDYSNTSFTCSPVAIGAGSFIGNDVHVPAQARLGDNCLLATKVQIPLDGRIRANIGLLGSPAFEIPRSAPTDDVLDAYRDPELKARRQAMKLRSNVGSMIGYVGARLVLLVALFTTALAIEFRRDPLSQPQLVALVLAATVALLVLGTLFAALVEWVGLRFRRLQPRHCSIYDSYYWYHERHWKWGRLIPSGLFNGTPIRPLVWRLLGVRMGRRVVDEGCLIPERSLTTIGDDTCLNERTTIQGHSLEDGVFKSDYVTIGSACTIGVGAFVHYGTRIEDEAVLGTDCFLLKGETVPGRAIWSGNPARAERRPAAATPPLAPPASQAGAASRPVAGRPGSS